MKNYLLAAALLLSANFSFSSENTSSAQVIEIQVTEGGFEPGQIDVKPDTPVILKITRKTDNTCATEIQIKEKKIKKELPLNETVSVDLGKLKKGEHGFSCGMNMLSGSLNSK